MTADSWKSLIIKILLMILTPLAAQLHLSMGATDISALAADLADIAVLAYGVYRSSGMKLVPHAAVAIDPHTPQDAAAPVGANVAGKVVGILLVAFALSFLVAGDARAQAQGLRKPAVTGNIPADIKTDLAGGVSPGAPGRLLTGNPEKDIQALWQKIVSSSLTDLNYAAAMAKNANTSTSQVRLQCIQSIITLNEQASGANLKNADGTPMAKPDPHAFTDVESLAEVIDNLSPQGPLFVGCSGAAQLAKTNVLSFVNALVTGAAGLAVMPVIPGL